MENGYYLSTYLSISDYCHIKDIWIRHDQNLALWHKADDHIDLIHYWELERYTGMKHQFKPFYSVEQAEEIIGYFLSEYNLTLADIRAVWGTPQLERCNTARTPKAVDSRFSYHSFAHLFSGMMMDTQRFEEELIISLAVDGGPDGSYDNGMFGRNLYVGAVSRQGEIIDYLPVCSPALLWSFMREKFSMQEGSLMALGSASSSKLFAESLPEMDIYSYHDYLKVKEHLEQLILAVEALDDTKAETIFNGFDSRFTERENKISMIVKIVSDFSDWLMCKNIERIIDLYNIDTSQAYLSLTGGFALNCPTNTQIIERYKFKGLLSPPCVNDSGLSLGIGLYEFYSQAGPFQFNLNNAYYGKRCTDNEFLIVMEKYAQYIISCSSFDPAVAVEDIIQHPIVWFNGAAEIGPRALGNRSLLADPRTERSKDILNEIKQREWWRPVAPVILEEEVKVWFQNGGPSPYMLNAFKIRDEKKPVVPAICHLDDTARVQTIQAKDNPYLAELIEAFKERTGVPILCNTSLNDKIEPIINRFEEALHFALKKRIPVMYVNGYRLEFATQLAYPGAGIAEKEIHFDINDIEVISRHLEIMHNEEWIIYYKNYYMFQDYNLAADKDRMAVKKKIRLLALASFRAGS